MQKHAEHSLNVIAEYAAKGTSSFWHLLPLTAIPDNSINRTYYGISFEKHKQNKTMSNDTESSDVKISFIPKKRKNLRQRNVSDDEEDATDNTQDTM